MTVIEQRLRIRKSIELVKGQKGICIVMTKLSKSCAVLFVSYSCVMIRRLLETAEMGKKAELPSSELHSHA